MGPGSKRGHTAIVVAEDPGRGIEALRDANGEVRGDGYVRSQAGVGNVNQAVATDQTDVFDEDHIQGGFWVYDPAKDDSRGQKVVWVK